MEIFVFSKVNLDEIELPFNCSHLEFFQVSFQKELDIIFYRF